MKAPVDLKASILQPILNTTMSTTTISTTTDFTEGRYNLTPLMILLWVAVTIVFFCVCSTAYNSLLKTEQESEVNDKHITYGLVMDDMWRCGNIFSKFCCLNLFVKPHESHDDNAIPTTMHYHSHRPKKDEERRLITPGGNLTSYDTSKSTPNGGFEIITETTLTETIDKES